LSQIFADIFYYPAHPLNQRPNQQEEMPLKCYICAKEGVDTPAVAICIVCGMGVCMEHSKREELPVEDVVDWGLGKEKVAYPKTLPRILCTWCFAAFAQRKKA
jgi:hypothetical protein